ncbi:hypothetical protein NQ314_020600 [Rhamnusium bicolor]|uniref:Photosystem I assembly protein Ycf4 n=1 Tax=Rhamnusium bicolor TaxID=1586634 RepID=A0AAV8WL64_9CUCU|nr:hypothetical protein NQ314_020600 [Rhamnusium bicolor]
MWLFFRCFLIFYLLFVIFASFYEGVARYQNKDVYEKITGTTAGRIITSFSIPKNWQRLKSTSNNPDFIKLRSIQGIRFYNMICVILCHNIMISFAGPVANTKYIENVSIL